MTLTAEQITRVELTPFKQLDELKRDLFMEDVQRDDSGLPRGGGGNSIWNRRGCSSEVLNLTPKGDQTGRGLSKLWPLEETI